MLSHKGDDTILWNQQVRTDTTIHNNKPDVIISNDLKKKKETRVLVDVAIPGDRNVMEKEAENILKYKDIIIEIQLMWNVKATVLTY